MKIKFTEDMLTQPINKTIFKIDWGKGYKQSDWKRWRVLEVARGSSTHYEIETTSVEPCFGLPRIFGGKGFVSGNLVWGDGCSFEKNIFESYQEAITYISGSIEWMEDMECKTKRTIISTHPSEGNN